MCARGGLIHGRITSAASTPDVFNKSPSEVLLASRKRPLQIGTMTPKALLDEILRLPVDERLQLVEQVWDSIAATPEAVPVPDWHKAELDRRLDQPSPEASLTEDEVRARLRKEG